MEALESWCGGRTMVDPKKHHFSPVFYLKGRGDANSKVVEYSRPHDKVVWRRVSPEGTGFKPFLYTLEGAPEDRKQEIEKKYMAEIVDNRGALALKVLIARNQAKLTEKLRNDWTRFLIASLYRRPQAVNNVIDTFGDVLRKNLSEDLERYESLKEKGDPPTPFEWIEKHDPHFRSDAGKRVMVSSIENQGIGDIIINMRWSTFDLAGSKHELLTSDAPHLRFYRLKDKRCVIVFPLSPRFLFIATHDRKAESVLLAQGASAIARWVIDNIVRIAERYVYGRTESHLLFVEKRLCLPRKGG
jgi:Protein of unknown function (DUF4238)